MRLLSVVALGVFLSAGAATAAPRRYLIDAHASQVTIHVGRAGLFRFAGHEHEVVAGTLRGTATVDAEQIARSSVAVTFDAAALRVTGKGEPAKDVPKVQAEMLGPKCLDVARFPSIRFVSKSVTGGGVGPGPREIAIRGDLTLHGVTREITVTGRVVVDARSVEANGTLTLRQKDFGIEPISVAGVVNVKNELTLTWRMVGQLADPL